MAYYIHDNIYTEDGNLYLNLPLSKEQCKVVTKNELNEIIDDINVNTIRMQNIELDLDNKLDRKDFNIVNGKIDKIKCNSKGEVGINIEPIFGRGSLQISSPNNDVSNSNEIPEKSNISIYSSEKIVCQETVNFSDERIKTNITTIKDDESLELLRKIEPKKYEYIDKAKRGSSPTFGFIAQDLKNVVPSSVDIINEFIPNIYSIARVNKNIISLNDAVDVGFQDFIRVIVRNNSLVCQVVNVSPDKKVLVVDTVFEDEWIFVYGKMVYDFLTINHDSIFSINVSATRELDKRVTELTNKITSIDKDKDSFDKVFSTQIKSQPNEVNFITIDRNIKDLVDFHCISQINNYIFKPTQDVFITPNPFGKIIINWRNTENICKTYKVTLKF
jgi:hypothetical protein